MDRQGEKRAWLWLFWFRGPYPVCMDVMEAQVPTTGMGLWAQVPVVAAEVWVVATGQGAIGYRDTCIQGASSYGRWLDLLLWVWMPVWDCQQPSNSEQLQ